MAEKTDLEKHQQVRDIVRQAQAEVEAELGFWHPNYQAEAELLIRERLEAAGFDPDARPE